MQYDTGLILGKSSVLADERVKKYANLAEMAADGFTDDNPEYKAAVAYFAQVPTPASVYVGYRATSEAADVALAACYDVAGAFWSIFVCDAAEADVKSAVEYLEANKKRGIVLYTVASYSAAILESGLFAVMKGKKTRRAAGVVSANAYAAAALMGCIAGLAHKYKDSNFSVCYKTLQGIEPTVLTQTQIDGIAAVNGNVYVTRGYRHTVFEHAVTGSGLRIDEVLYLDLMAADMQDALIDLIVGSGPRLSQNDSTSGRMINTLSPVLTGYLNRGVIATNVWRGGEFGSLQTGDMLDSGFYIYIPPYSQQSQEDREAHKAMPVHVCLTLAGSVESVELTVDVQR